MTVQTPSLGRVVLALVNPATNNGADVAPAVLTRVWNEQPDGSWVVNCKVNLDGDGSAWLTSARLFDDEAQARAFGGQALFWPPRA